ncbi:MAG: citrate lyase subunit alpha [Candidatus Izimaplasma sp.]|nr:citrate lyase subunit alpha [Candidatus Izimaplasma bacterium]
MTKKPIIFSYKQLPEEIDIHDFKNISFHHHLRNGDTVLNNVLQIYENEHVKKLNLFPSAIFPAYTKILDLLKNNQINGITTNYMNGPVADYLSHQPLPGKITMQTHGGRARRILNNQTTLDIAYIASPYVDPYGNAIGYKGKSVFGSMGYAIADAQKAKIVVLITDKLIDTKLEDPEIDGSYVDYILQVDSIGDTQGIVSGTTQITTNPIGVKIAKQTTSLIKELGLLKNGFSFQSGAGGISLRVTENLKEEMVHLGITASFFSGGITQYHVDMLEAGLVDKLYDVQCFDLAAINSLRKNTNHMPISASVYANPEDPNQVIKDLDIVILGATEIDYDFNVNVTTDSHGKIIGGSGGHSDTASESKVSIIVSPLIRSRIPLIKERVTTITTLGKHIDCLVTERGIAINPKRQDLIDKLSKTNLPLKTIKQLQEEAFKYTKQPKKLKKYDTMIGDIQDRTNKIIDHLYKK